MWAYGRLMVFIGFPGSTCHICHMPWPYTLFQSFRFGAFGIWCLDFFLVSSKKTCNDLSTLAVIKSGSLSRRFPNSYSTIVYWFLLYPFLCIYIYITIYIGFIHPYSILCHYVILLSLMVCHGCDNFLGQVEHQKLLRLDGSVFPKHGRCCGALQQRSSAADGFFHSS